MCPLYRKANWDSKSLAAHSHSPSKQASMKLGGDLNWLTWRVQAFANTSCVPSGWALGRGRRGDWCCLDAQRLRVESNCQEQESVIMFTFLILSYFMGFDICTHHKIITTLKIMSISITPRSLLRPLCNHSLPPAFHPGKCSSAFCHRRWLRLF